MDTNNNNNNNNFCYKALNYEINIILILKLSRSEIKNCADESFHLKRETMQCKSYI